MRFRVDEDLLMKAHHINKPNYYPRRRHCSNRHPMAGEMSVDAYKLSSSDKGGPLRIDFRCLSLSACPSVYIITSAKEVMFYPSFACLLFVCLLANSRKNTGRIFLKILSVHKEGRYCSKSSASGSWRFRNPDFKTCAGPTRSILILILTHTVVIWNRILKLQWQHLTAEKENIET